MTRIDTKKSGRFAPLYERYFMDPAIAEVNPMAELLFVRTLAFCAGSPQTDGFVADVEIARWIAPDLPDAADLAMQLAKAELWIRDDERPGYHVRSWLDWNDSADEIKTKMSRDRWRKRAAATRPQDSGGNPAGSTPDSSGNPARTAQESGDGGENLPQDSGGNPARRTNPPARTVRDSATNTDTEQSTYTAHTQQYKSPPEPSGAQGSGGDPRYRAEPRERAHAPRGARSREETSQQLTSNDSSDGDETSVCGNEPASTSEGPSRVGMPDLDALREQLKRAAIKMRTVDRRRGGAMDELRRATGDLPGFGEVDA